MKEVGICAEEANINNSQAGCTDQQVRLNPSHLGSGPALLFLTVRTWEAFLGLLLAVYKIWIKIMPTSSENIK